MIFSPVGNKPFSSSYRWRYKFNRGRHTTFCGYRSETSSFHTSPYTSVAKPFMRMEYWAKRESFVYDEYDHHYYNTSDATSPINLRKIPFREIPAIVTTHDIGNGKNDYQPSKINVDLAFDTRRYTGYQYHISTNADPKVLLHHRVGSYVNETPTKSVDLVAANMTAMPQLNPFQSVRQSPGGTVVSPDDINAFRESLQLVVPLTKFRRAGITISTLGKVSTVRAITFEMNEFERRSFG